jgi:Glycosyl transferase family 90
MQLYVLSACFKDNDHRRKGVAILAAIYRSITAIPYDVPIPNIEWVFAIEDFAPDPSKPVWSLSRRSNDESLWVMPDFGFWSWAIPDLGPFDAVASQIADDEMDSCFECKHKKAVWRGSIWTAPILRRALLDVSKDKDWSDIQAIREDVNNGAANYLGAAEQCHYMISVHAEGMSFSKSVQAKITANFTPGRSYSGSLKYRQACRSVVVIHQLQWIQHYHYLLIPSGPKQNYVEVRRDFSDLESKVLRLLADPEEAKRIADNSVKTFRERYLTMAAEACYWRKLIHAWGNSAFEPELYEDYSVSINGSVKVTRQRRGMRFETFA